MRRTRASNCSQRKRRTRREQRIHTRGKRRKRRSQLDRSPFPPFPPCDFSQFPRVFRFPVSGRTPTWPLAHLTNHDNGIVIPRITHTCNVLSSLPIGTADGSRVAQSARHENLTSLVRRNCRRLAPPHTRWRSSTRRSSTC